MKTSLLICFSIFSSSLFSQLTLTQALNEPVAGEVESAYILDTSAFTAGLPLSISGNNAVWNFTNLTAFPFNSDGNYLSPSSVTNSASFPGCSFVHESSGFYTFYKSVTSPSQTEILGITTSTLSLTFTNSAIAAKYPISFGSVSTDNLAGSFTFSVTGTCSGNIVTNADGQGTLNLPQNISLTNVLRLKSVQSLTLSAAIIPGFPTPVGTIKQTIYRFYHSSQKFPILSVQYQAFSLITSSTPTVTGFATGNVNSFVTGLNENAVNVQDISIYPNPASDHLNVKVNGSFISEIKVFNQLGQTVGFGDATQQIDISSLNNGIYTIQVKTDKGTIRKKIIKE